jgi:hypothetical protein
MQLPEGRVGPYVRALSAGLNQLAPHGDFVPLIPALAHLRALDPAVSGDQLAPAEVHDRTGMPSFTWMQRAISEKKLSDGQPDPSESDIERASRLDPALARRLAHRRTLRVHLRENELLPATMLQCELRRMGSSTEVSGAYDRLAPDGRWLRIRFIVEGPGNVDRIGPFRIGKGGKLFVDPLLQHMFTRHFATQLMALREQIEDHCAARVIRLTRSWVGPFWFPGIQLPPEVPAELGKGLLVQLSTEVVAIDVHHAMHLDPLVPERDETPPPGQRIFRERRFAASANVIEAVRTLCREAGTRCPITPLEGRSRRRAL